jgi:hypothetical protein
VVRLQQVLAADIKLNRITAPDNLLPRSGWPQREPPFEKLGKRPERVRQLQLAEQSPKICENDHDEVLEEMRRMQLLDYDEEEETDNEQEEDDVSTSDVNNDSESDNDTSDDDT